MVTISSPDAWQGWVAGALIAAAVGLGGWGGLIWWRLRRQINGSDIGEPETRAYLTQFEYTGGRVHVRTFKEIPYG